jgi:hypothetical protein
VHVVVSTKYRHLHDAGSKRTVVCTFKEFSNPEDWISMMQNSPHKNLYYATI